MGVDLDRGDGARTAQHRGGSDPRHEAPRPRARTVIAIGLAVAALVLLLVAAALAGGPGPLLFAPLAVACASVGAVLWHRRTGGRMGVLFLFTGLSIAFVVVVGAYADAAARLDLPGRQWAAWLFQSALALSSPFFLIIQLFPTGRPVSPRWRWLVGFTIVVASVQLLASALGVTTEFRSNFPGVTHPLQLLPGGVTIVLDNFGGMGILVVFLLSAVEMVLRYRRSTGEERLQMRWFAAAAAIAAVAFSIGFLTLPDPSIAFAVASPLVPIAAGTAIQKYRLYDIELVVKRTVVAGALLTFGTLVYVGVVVGVGTLIGDRSNGVLTLSAAIVVAVAFQPFRSRARSLADRIVYGDRATPYEILAEFGHRAGASYSAEEVLPLMAQILGQGTGAELATVWLRIGSGLRLDAVWPVGSAAAATGETVPLDDADRLPGTQRSIPVVHQGEVLGALGVTMPPAEPFAPSHERLIADLASQAGLVLRNVGLIEELRASRQRLVAAQDQERRRLERNLHDGAQQQLVALSVQLGLARRLAAKDAPQIAEMLEGLQQQSTEALEDLRDLARGIYPPLLADKGLVSAIEGQARRSVVPVEISDGGIGRYPQEVEAAVYFSILEAMQNVAKYSGARTVTIRLSEADGVLSFQVADDGSGFDASSTTYGTGLQGMADRLAVLDGTLAVQSTPGAGTTVSGTIPVHPLPAPG